MKIKHRIPLISIGTGILVFVGFAGTISGSLAWWAYSTRASMGYQGTSVASSEQLQIGIHVPDANDDGNPDVVLTSLGMVYEKVRIEDGDEDSTNDKFNHYYFCDAGTGLQAEVISYYLRYQGQYAVDKLIPVTSGSYTSGDLSLKEALVSGTPMNNNIAETKKYVKIPLAFKIQKYDNSHTLIAATGENIWLSGTVVEASTVEDGEVYKAIRVFTDGYEAVTNGNNKELVAAKRLINPSSNETTMGSTAVAGLLDISGSGYYDTYTKNNNEYAIIYGETNLTDQQKAVAEAEVQQGESESDLVDFNKTRVSEQQALERSTFVSKYAPGTHHPNNQTSILPKYQNYDTLKSLKASDEGSGILSGGKPVCATDLVTGIAELGLTIWLEGWDHNVIDKENQHSFNLGLQFQISRL